MPGLWPTANNEQNQHDLTMIANLNRLGSGFFAQLDLFDWVNNSLFQWLNYVRRNQMQTKLLN